MTEQVTRFSPRQRLEHALVMSLFLLLAATGFPQKFSDAGWAQWLINVFGGVNRARFFHRWAGILFAALVAVHFASAIVSVLAGNGSLSLVPTRKDFKDAVITLRYYLGLSDEQARFDRYDYRQKFEYWGLVLGGVVMIATGFALYLPVLATRFLPGEVIPAAKVAHSNEGLLAFLVVITWHVYNAHLSPDVFPFDTSIFTGKVTRERMQHEHPLEYARLRDAEMLDAPPAAGEGAAGGPTPGARESAEAVAEDGRPGRPEGRPDMNDSGAPKPGARDGAEAADDTPESV